MAQTETSAGYTDVSESDIRAADEAGGAADEQEYGLEEEYEDEEDRLIAQGGMGIPLDEVSLHGTREELKLTQRTAIQPHCFLPCLRNITGGNAWCLIWTRPFCIARLR